MKKLKRMLLGLFLISSVIYSCQPRDTQPWEKYLNPEQEIENQCDTISYARETKIFTAYTDSLKITIPEEDYTFIMIPSASCGGCVSSAIYVLFPNSGNNTTLIVSEKIAQEYTQLCEKERVVIDKTSLCDRLNWEYANIIEIKTKNKQVVYAKSYSTEKMYNM